MTTSTSRFDSIAARGTGPSRLERVRLADGQGIAVHTRPGADTVREVYVSPGVTLPAAEGRPGEQRIDVWLTPGRLIKRACYLDVPVEDVRDLIARHGGEHTDQSHVWGIPHPEDLPLLDHLTATGTDGSCEVIRLADGHFLSLMTGPGAETAEEVFLYPGLIAPDTEAWEREDQWEGWLTGGDFGDGRLYVEVPVAAVRELIVQHGGQHTDQSVAPVPPPVEEDGPEAPATLADLRGRFEDGYTTSDIRAVFGRIFDESGLYLVCVWDYVDEYGAGGSSQFYAEDEDGDLSEVQPEIHQWLSGQRDVPDGPVDTWVCAPAEQGEFAIWDGYHNYARANRSDG
jgi:hypothetical protein